MFFFSLPYHHCDIEGTHILGNIDINQYWAIYGDGRVILGNIWRYWGNFGRYPAISWQFIVVLSPPSRNGSVKWQAKSSRAVLNMLHYDIAQKGRVNNISLTLCIVSHIYGVNLEHMDCWLGTGQEGHNDLKVIWRPISMFFISTDLMVRMKKLTEMLVAVFSSGEEMEGFGEVTAII